MLMIYLHNNFEFCNRPMLSFVHLIVGNNMYLQPNVEFCIAHYFSYRLALKQTLLANRFLAFTHQK